jgi:ComF family protein
MPAIKAVIQQYLQGIAQLVYPLQCWGCGSDLISIEERICISCHRKLPETFFTGKADNPVEKIFYGRLPIAAATSLYYFSKDSLLQHLLHQLKYKGNQELGVHFGKTLGRRLKENNRFDTVNCLTPIPLSNKRIKQRGYNQALSICNGIADILSIPVFDHLIIRRKDNASQTHKNRQERWENMQHLFHLENPELIAGKHLLLVDDVVTTGATLEACGEALLKAPGIKLSIASLAYAIV